MRQTNFETRVAFYDDIEVMEVDFSNITFETTVQVHTAYDIIERRLSETGRQWFFLVNYKNCRIFPEAWLAYAHRGKGVNLDFSLGTVRYAVPDETGREIMDRARTEEFDANLFVSRDAALSKLADMRAAAQRTGKQTANG